MNACPLCSPYGLTFFISGFVLLLFYPTGPGFYLGLSMIVLAYVHPYILVGMSKVLDKSAGEQK